MYRAKKVNLAMAVTMALGASAANAEIEISGHLKNETAFFTDSGQLIGEEKTQYDKSDSHSDTLKFENSARLFVNGELGEESSWHLDLNLIYDTEGVESEFKGHENYTQHDWLKEAYIDTRWGNTDIRIGKQQVVWGTADGIKLLDIINPTDYREFSQNTMEDSRIPIWMINTDTLIGESGSLQFIIAEHEENKIPGLDKDGDKGHPYTVQGVDTITGEVNGFLNVAPALSSVASSFTGAAAGGAFAGFGIAGANGLADTSGGGTGAFTVDFYARSNWTVNPAFAHGLVGPGAAAAGPTSVLVVTPDGATANNGSVLLNFVAQQGLGGLTLTNDPKANYSVTNLMNQDADQNWSFGYTYYD